MKLFILPFVAALVLSFVGCAGDSSNSASSGQEKSSVAHKPTESTTTQTNIQKPQ